MTSVLQASVIHNPSFSIHDFEKQIENICFSKENDENLILFQGPVNSVDRIDFSSPPKSF